MIEEVLFKTEGETMGTSTSDKKEEAKQIHEGDTHQESMQVNNKGQMTKQVPVLKNGVMTFYNSILSFDIDKLPEAL